MTPADAKRRGAQSASLVACDLSFRYADDWVLRGASLTIAPGEIVGLWGPSGCGKSTLGRLLSGRLEPATGTVTRPPATGKAHPVQLVLQHADQSVNPRWPVRDILAEADPGLDPVLDSGLVDPAWLDAFPHEISGGELQRVNLARALLARPAFLIADEITASLDAITQAQMWRTIQTDVVRGAYGVLAISHDQPLLATVASRIVPMADLNACPG